MYANSAHTAFRLVAKHNLNLLPWFGLYRVKYSNKALPLQGLLSSWHKKAPPEDDAKTLAN